MKNNFFISYFIPRLLFDYNCVIQWQIPAANQPQIDVDQTYLAWTCEGSYCPISSSIDANHITGYYINSTGGVPNVGDVIGDNSFFTTNVRFSVAVLFDGKQLIFV